ncbi:VanZ family protein [Bacillus taeanensis]|uniref:VanZ-like domain-containing protein n=1 Tax=Bacillus taeanensis TaxID=273032 RepID=A0A366XVT0_9BACI|nr:VanZ family protein [Bacillus taeanensis]RBW68849.1 hypothetical protein DS031_14010 [Bacillus taeanensis]
MTMFDLIAIGMDKWQHFLFYGFISFIISLMMSLLPPLANGLRRISAVWFTLIVVSLLEEYRQLFLPDRTAELLDGLANIAGVSVGVVIPLFLHFIWRFCYQKRVRVRSVLSFWTIVIVVFTPLLYGLSAFEEPIPPKAAKSPSVVETSALVNSASSAHSIVTPEEILQKYYPPLEELRDYAKNEMEQLASEAVKEYKEKEMSFNALVAAYIIQGNALEKEIDEEFQHIYENAKRALQDHHYDPSYADKLKKEYEETKKAAKTNILQKSLGELF